MFAFEKHGIEKEPKLEEEEEEIKDYPGAGTLGDIMSIPEERRSTMVPKDGLRIPSGLVTSSGGNLQARFCSKMKGRISSMERIALTANGNLQRIFSSYYDAPVHVIVDYCHLSPSTMSSSSSSSDDDDDYHVWDRCVHLSVYSQTFCTAFSKVTVHSNEWARLVTSGQVGLGQLFRYLDKLPTFQLLDAGRLETGGMWREYTLESDKICCEIREEFSPTAWNICPPEAVYFEEHDNSF